MPSISVVTQTKVAISFEFSCDPFVSILITSSVAANFETELQQRRVPLLSRSFRYTFRLVPLLCNEPSYPLFVSLNLLRLPNKWKQKQLKEPKYIRPFGMSLCLSHCIASVCDCLCACHACVSLSLAHRKGPPSIA